MNFEQHSKRLLYVIVFTLFIVPPLVYRPGSVSGGVRNGEKLNIIHSEGSPGKSKELTEYLINNFGKGSEYMVTFKGMDTGLEKNIFIGNRTGRVKWLGDDHAFYTDYCGTGCQQLILINVSSSDKASGMLSYMPRENGQEYTVFDDWFGKQFNFDGIPDDIYSQTVGDKTWLVFKMVNEDGASLGENRLLFDGSSLKIGQKYQRLLVKKSL